MKTRIIYSLLLIAHTVTIEIVNAQSWNLAGNAGTTPATQFIGTTDALSFKVRTNNVPRVHITSSGKVGIGNFTPSYLLDVKGGSINTDSVYRINGYDVLKQKGGSNIFLGINSGNTTTTGISNTVTGNYSMRYNTSGSYNTASGNNALNNNTTGSSNAAFGNGALSQNVSGNYNTALGHTALYNNTSGRFNVGVGYNALSGNTTSYYNTAIGYLAGYSYAHGWFMTFIGSQSNANNSGYTNSIALGEASTVTASNQTRIGNSVVTSTGAYTGWTNISDGRYKKNVKEDVKGIDFIMKLRPVTYNLDVSGISNKLNESRGKERNEYMQNAISEKEKIIYSGFVAQEVEQAAKELGYDFSGVDKPKNENDFYGLRYAEFVVPLVKAVQELNEAKQKSETRSQKLEEENEKLIQRIEKLESLLSGSTSSLSFSEKSGNHLNTSSGYLEQNSPNPFSQKTGIKFYIPASSQIAELKIYSADGKELKSFIISSKGEGQVEMNANSFSAGIYNYTLFIDGKISDTRQMILTKQ